MCRIENIKPIDRNTIYNLMQQNNDLTQQEISTDIEIIDQVLFDNNPTIRTIITKTDKNMITGYAIYGTEPHNHNTFIIYRIWNFQLTAKSQLNELLLNFTESDIQRKKGGIIKIELSSEKKYLELFNFLLNKNYLILSQKKNYYEPGIDQNILFKKFDNLKQRKYI